MLNMRLPSPAKSDLTSYPAGTAAHQAVFWARRLNDQSRRRLGLCFFLTSYSLNGKNNDVMLRAKGTCSFEKGRKKGSCLFTDRSTHHYVFNCLKQGH